MSTTQVQLTVDNQPALGAPGMLYDASYFKDVVSCRALVDIPFGAYVDIIGNTCELPTTTGKVTGNDGGVAIQSQEFATEAGYKAGDLVNVLRVGRIWVSTEDANADGSSPFIRFTANVAPVGSIRGTDADAGKAVQKPGVTIFRGNAAAGLAVLQLNGRVTG
jgi:hypothetical protein